MNLFGWFFCLSTEFVVDDIWLQDVSTGNYKLSHAVKPCKQNNSETTMGPGRPAVSSRQLRATVKPVQTLLSDRGLRRSDRTTASAGGRNRPAHAAWK